MLLWNALEGLEGGQVWYLNTKSRVPGFDLRQHHNIEVPYHTVFLVHHTLAAYLPFRRQIIS